MESNLVGGEVRASIVWNDRRGFTLIEVLLVVMLLGLILAFTLPNLGGELKRRSLLESADRLRSLIHMTYARSIQDGIQYRVFFPGTPDPLDKHAKEEIDVPVETLQPIVQRQVAPINNPEAYGDVHDPWNEGPILQEGTRCVAVLPGKPNFDISAHSPIAGPAIWEGEAPFVQQTFRPDGTGDWVTYVLTDLPVDVELEPHHVSRIINVIVDGRTGEVWLQRAFRVEEVELMQEEGASPILHMDFTDAREITKDNILHVQVGQSGGRVGRSEPTP